MVADHELSTAYARAAEAYQAAATALEDAAKRLNEIGWSKAAKATYDAAHRAKMHAINRERHAKSWGDI